MGDIPLLTPSAVPSSIAALSAGSLTPTVLERRGPTELPAVSTGL